MEEKKQVNTSQGPHSGDVGNLTGKKPVKDVAGFKEIEYEKGKKDPLVIEIQIIRREHESKDYLANDDKPEDMYHYYIFYAKGDPSEKPGVMNELNEKLEDEKLGDEGVGPGIFNGKKNYTNTYVSPGQRIKWVCIYPFTIYYGGTSIITTDKFGWPRPRQIIPYLKAYKSKRGDFYETPDVYIVNNILFGKYKYFVSVYIPEADIICVDDPQNHVPPPT